MPSSDSELERSKRRVYPTPARSCATVVDRRVDADPSATHWRMDAGREALLVRYHVGHGTVAPRDQVQFDRRRVPALAALLYLILTKARAG